jgi:hypothetical protein
MREVLESDESDVIHCWAFDSLASLSIGTGAGRFNIIRPNIDVRTEGAGRGQIKIDMRRLLASLPRRHP